MEKTLLILWLIGLASTIITAITVRLHTKRDRDLAPITKAILYILSFNSEVIFGGITLGVALSLLQISLFFKIILLLFFAPIVFCGLFFILQSYEFEGKKKRWFLLIAFIGVIFASNISINNYFNNIETVVTSSLTRIEERDILHLYTSPQKDFTATTNFGVILGFGSGNFNVESHDNIAYWYKNNNGEYVYAYADAFDSKIIPINSNDKPHLKILYYEVVEHIVNHNNDTEKISKTEIKEKYEFYLPFE